MPLPSVCEQWSLVTLVLNDPHDRYVHTGSCSYCDRPATERLHLSTDSVDLCPWHKGVLTRRWRQALMRYYTRAMDGEWCHHRVRILTE
jgi:hypothetical protein